VRLLLDTNALLWSLDNSPRLSKRATDFLNDPSKEKVVSIVSFWEITIKVSIQKLVLKEAPDRLLERFERDRLSLVLPIQVLHLRILKTLPHHYKDPFDRLIVSQALAENLTLVSSDGSLDTYGVQRIW
jgi:PIN domain nuclease of toxin-antitoxin system